MRAYINRFVKFLGKKLGIDLAYFLKNHFYLSTATTVNIITGFILSLLYARFLDKTTYGQYVLIFSLISTLGVTRITGLQSIFPYAVMSGAEGFFWMATKFSFIASLLGSLFLIGAGLYYSLPGKPPLSNPLYLAALLFPLVNALSYYTSYLPTRKMFEQFTFYSIIQSTIPNLFIAIAVILFPNIFWIILAALLPQSILNIYFTYKTLKLVKNNKTSSKDLHYGMKLSLVHFFPVLFQKVDDLILAKTLGFENLAIYSFANTIPREVGPFFSNIETVAAPKLGEMSEKRIFTDMPKKALQLTAFNFFPVLAYILVAPLFFHFFYPQYSQSILPSQIYSLTIIFGSFSLITQSFHRLRLIRSTVTFTWLTFIARLVFLVILIPKFGILGAALAAVLSEGFKLLLGLVMLARLGDQTNEHNPLV